MPALPGTIALTNIADGASIVAADHRNNYAAIQAAVNALIADLSGGSAGALLQALSAGSIGYLPDAPADGQGLLWDASTSRWRPAGACKQIADTTLGGGAATIDFTAIPASFAHLMVVLYLRGDTAAANIQVNARFNNDSGTNYDSQAIYASAAAPASIEAFAQTSALLGNCPANTAAANLFAAYTILIPHYAAALNNKSFWNVAASKIGVATTNLTISTWASFWRSNAAINRLTLLPAAGNFVTGSRATLYGLG